MQTETGSKKGIPSGLFSFVTDAHLFRRFHSTGLRVNASARLLSDFKTMTEKVSSGCIRSSRDNLFSYLTLTIQFSLYNIEIMKIG